MSATIPETGNDESLPQLTARPIVSGRRLGVFLSLALLGGVACCWGVATLRYQSYRGYYQAVSVNVVAPQAGKVLAVQVRPGAIVEAGTPLVTLGDPEHARQKATKEQRLSELQTRLQQAQEELKVELTRRTTLLNDAIFQTKLRAAGYLRQEFSDRIVHLASQQRVRVPTAPAPREETNSPLTPLLSRSPWNEEPEGSLLEPLLYREAARNAVDAARTQVKLCDERLVLLQQDLAKLPEQLAAELEIATREAQVATAQQALDEFLAQPPQSVQVTATCHGTVGMLRVVPGESLATQAEITTLFDEDRPSILLPVPAANLAELSSGTAVVVVFPGGQTRNGVIEALPPQAVTVPNGHSPVPSAAGVVALQVRPVGLVWPKLPFGAEVEVRRMRFSSTTTP